LSEPLLLDILPLALGAAASPVVVVGEIYCLVEPAAGVRRGAMYATGNALVVALWVVIGLTLGHTLPETQHATDWFSVVLRLSMGLAMLALGTNLLIKRPPKDKATRQSTSKHPDLRAFSIGMGLMAPNLSSLVLFFPALAAITRGATSNTEEFYFIGLLVLLTMSPCLIPLLLATVSGRRGRSLLDRFNNWLKPKQRVLGLLVCFATAIYLIISGILAA
jgi:threonine/homoserine/homoserine lactone efflux protein